MAREQAARKRPPVAELALEQRATVADQPVPEIGRPRVVAGVRRRGLRHCCTRDFELVVRRAPREVLHRAAIAVARNEVHRREHRIAGQRLVDEARRLDEIRPFVRGHEPHAGDQVAHRQVGRRLPGDFELDHRFRARAFRRKSLRQVRQRDPRGRIAVPQALEQLHGERARPAGRGSRGLERHVVDDIGREAGQRVGVAIGLAASDHRCDDARSETARVLDHHDAQHRRQRPQLGERERRNRLVGGDEPQQQVGVEAAVGVRDERPCDAVYARQAGERPGIEPRQAGEKALGQQRPDVAELVLDNVEVVDEPIGGGRDQSLDRHRFADCLVRFTQDRRVVGIAVSERAPARRTLADGLRLRERNRVLLEPLGTEELRPQRLFVVLGEAAGARGAEPAERMLHGG